jgi:hypothetical protein
MKTAVYLALAAGLVLGLAFIVGRAMRPLRANAEPDLWALTVTSPADGATDLHVRQHLQDGLDQAHNRFAAKRSVAAQVIAGRLNLMAAADCFREINSAVPRYQERFALNHPDTPYEVLLCGQVIAAVEAEAVRQGSKAARELVERLRSELRSHLGQSESVVLVP